VNSIPTYAVVPTEGRPCLHDCLAALRDQVDRVILVANNGYTGADAGRGAWVAVDTEKQPNISRWWNIGLDAAWDAALLLENTDRWNVIVLNDDTVMAPGSVGTLTAGLRRHEGAHLAFCGPQEKLLTRPGPDRITGWCFALRGEGGLRADEELKWWAGDNDLDWRARESGGSVIVPGVEHTHLYPNGYTVQNRELSEQAGRDMAVFTHKWGRTAW